MTTTGNWKYVNARASAEESALNASNEANYREMQNESARLIGLISDLHWCDTCEFLDKAAEIAKTSRLIASHAEALK